MIKAYWLRLALFALGGALLALGMSMLAPKKYEAVLQVMVDQKPISPTMGQSMAERSVEDLLDFARSRTLGTQVQQLVSLGVIQQAANKVAQIRNVPEPNSPSSEFYPPTLQQNIFVSAEQQSDIIELRIRMSEPLYAEDMANEMFLAFESQNKSNAQALAQQAIGILDHQAEAVESNLKAVDQKQAEIRTKYDAPDIMLKIQATQQEISELQKTRDMASIEALAARRRANTLGHELRNLAKKKDESRSTTTNNNYQALERELSLAEAELNQLKTVYTPANDRYKLAQERVNSLRKDLANTPKILESAVTVVDSSAYQTLRNGEAESRAQAEAAEARLIRAQQELDRRSGDLAKLPAVQMQLIDLQRQQVALEKLFLSYSDALKTLKETEMGRLSIVRQLNKPFVFEEPVSPKPMVNTIFGLLAGLILGVLSMLATEAKRQPVRSLTQLNGLALRPVYRIIPELRAPYRGLSKAPPEPYESLLANYLRSPNRPYRIGVVGINKDSGASTTAINLAIAGGRHGARTLLVQSDPRGGISRLTGQPAPDEGDVIEITPLIKGMSKESILGLSNDRNPMISDSLTSNEGDLTIIDLEPVTRSAEYAFVAPHVDEVILLVRAGRARSVEFLQAQQALRDAGCPQVTVAFTRSSDLSVVTDTLEAEGGDLPQPPKALES